LSLLGVETGGLSRAIVLGGELGARSARAEVLLHSAKLVLRARQALRDGEYGGLRQAVEEASENGASPEATSELNLLVDEVEDHRMRTALSNAILQGGPGGDAGELDTVGIRTRDLERAIKTTNALGAKSTRVRMLERTARVLRDLRMCVQTGDWEGANSVLQEQGERESAAIQAALDGSGGVEHGGHAGQATRKGSPGSGASSTSPMAPREQLAETQT